MSTTSVPRLVGAMWYPVPTPEYVPLTLGFPSEEACRAFCEAIEIVGDAREGEIEKLQAQLSDDLEKDMADEYERGFNDGKEEGDAEGFDRAHDECKAGACEGYDIGWADGYAQAGEVARSAESA